MKKSSKEQFSVTTPYLDPKSLRVKKSIVSFFKTAPDKLYMWVILALIQLIGLAANIYILVKCKLL